MGHWALLRYIFAKTLTCDVHINNLDARKDRVCNLIISSLVTVYSVVPLHSPWLRIHVKLPTFLLLHGYAYPMAPSASP